MGRLEHAAEQCAVQRQPAKWGGPGASKPRQRDGRVPQGAHRTNKYVHWYDYSHVFADECFLCDQNPNTHANTWRYDNPFADTNRYCNSSINANTHEYKGSVAHAVLVVAPTVVDES